MFPRTRSRASRGVCFANVPHSESLPRGCRRVARGLVVLLIGLLAATAGIPHAAARSTEGQAPTQGGLSAAELEALEDAAARRDDIAIRAVVIAAIVRDSSRTTAIVEDAVRAVPDYAASVVAVVGSTFPRLERRAAEAAEQADTGPGEREERDGGADPAPPAPRRPPPPAVAFDGLPEPPGGAGSEWSGETAIGGTYQEASSSSITAGFSSRIVLDSGPWRYSGKFDFDYGSTDGDTHTHRLNIEGRTQRALSDRLFAMALLDYDKDRFSGFDYQVSEGVGVGYRVFDHPSFILDVEGGPTLRQSRVEETGELDKELLARLAVHMDWQMTDTAGFSNETAVFVSNNAIDIESASRALVPDSSETRNISALDFDIFGDLSARLSYELSYRSDPPPGGRSTSSLGRISLIHSF